MAIPPHYLLRSSPKTPLSPIYSRRSLVESSKTNIVDICPSHLSTTSKTSSWWLEPSQQSLYPHLSRMALDLLTIPAMSADAEWIFSGCKRQMLPWRNRMSIKTLEALELLKSWMKLENWEDHDVSVEDNLEWTLRSGSCFGLLWGLLISQLLSSLAIFPAFWLADKRWFRACRAWIMLFLHIWLIGAFNGLFIWLLGLFPEIITCSVWFQCTSISISSVILSLGPADYAST
jgi:hypothetical protein